VPVRGDERRAFGRIELDPPLRGFLDEIPVSVVDVSVSGFRVAHDARIAPAPTRRIRLEWDDKEMEFGCVVARSTLFRLARTASEKSIYHSGVRILEPVGESEAHLRDLIARRVIRALEEQKANARGIPPLDNYTYRVGKGDRFRRCELIEGVWRKVETAIRTQPTEGFTVAAETSSREVEILCETYEQTTEEGRRLTRILAQLSISKDEGTGTRRYTP
jgi:hypothetical protein